MKVYISPYTNVDYASFYIQGLYELYGRKNVLFDYSHFKSLPINGSMKFVVVNKDKISKYVINYFDDDTIDEIDYDWCDYYGIINFRYKDVKRDISKIILLPPSFAIKIWGKLDGLLIGFINYIKLFPSLPPLKRFLSNYYKQSKQVPLTDYVPQKPIQDYVYSLNTLWNSDEWIRNDETVNLYRARFIEACKSSNHLKFEGGFIISSVKNPNPRFSNLIINAPWIPKTQYINKIKDSVIVFNTPAWALCHGWKLTEFLALGKAIISTPLYNDLPIPLEHGKHIHFTNGEENEIKEAIEKIINNTNYRRMLENNAREYYEKYVCPKNTLTYFLNLT